MLAEESASHAGSRIGRRRSSKNSTERRTRAGRSRRVAWLVGGIKKRLFPGAGGRRKRRRYASSHEVIGPLGRAGGDGAAVAGELGLLGGSPAGGCATASGTTRVDVG